MKHLYICLTILLSLHCLTAQNLKPSIGLGTVPADSETVCAIPTYTGSFNASGFQAGDTIPHFQLYDVNGNATDVLNVLQTGKPLLLIAGAYTCPVYRQKVAKINQVAAMYAGQINIYVVCVVEAHPKYPDFSPYSGTLWVTSENQSEGILFNQPLTYGDRKALVNTMLANNLYTLSVPVLIDGPCNAWWQNFGPAPNNAYLIKPDGVIYKKHAWFDKSPDNIYNDINALLSITGLKEATAEKTEVYPNPASSELHLKFPQTLKAAELFLYDVNGNEVVKHVITDQIHHAIDVSGISPGLYMYRVKGEQSILSGKILIE